MLTVKTVADAFSKGNGEILSVAGDVGAFRLMETPRGRPQIDAALIRQALRSFFLTDQGSLPCQWHHVRSTGPGPAQ